MEDLKKEIAEELEPEESATSRTLQGLTQQLDIKIKTLKEVFWVPLGSCFI